MDKDSKVRYREIDEHLGRLNVIAQSLVTAQWQRKLDPQDLVQVTLKSAYASFHKFDRQSDSDAVRGWLTEIMRNKWVDICKHYHAAKRNIDLERSFAAEFDQSVAGLDAWCPANQTSPSMAVSRNEQLAMLAEGLRQLSPEQREVVVQKHINNRSIVQIATQMERTPESVTGLLRRGLANLRVYLK
ncbi:MAG: sigma-70 family RNA polymerase sigma factor [Pirellula sp.]